MYGDSITKVVGSTVITGAGAVALPNTANNTVGTILAIIAITVGASALISQLIVRIMRRRYQ